MMAFILLRPNVFDLKGAVFAKHAQHVVFIHFPIALFITAVAFDVVAQFSNRRGFADAAYYNLLVAAISTLPAIITGVLAWQLRLEGQALKGTLLQHLVLGGISGGMICVAWWLQFRARRRKEDPPAYRFAIEIVGMVVVMLTGHLGGFLSGVNVPS